MDREAHKRRRQSGGGAEGARIELKNGIKDSEEATELSLKKKKLGGKNVLKDEVVMLALKEKV